MNNGRGWNRNWNGPGRGGGGYGRGYGYNSNRGGRGRNYGSQNFGYRGGWNNAFGGRGGYQNRYNNPPRETPGKRLSEEDIGVTEYISDHKGFNGIIKSRYADFHVAEINEDGEIAVLTDENPPELPTEDTTVLEDEDLLLNKYNLEILPMETWDKINELAVAQKPTTEKVEIDVTGMEKECRTKIHDAVKKAFGSAIVGKTVAVDDKKFVVFEKYRKGVRIDTRVKWAWPGEYVHFIVHKVNCDTMEAATRLAERMNIGNVKSSMIGYAGTKDRRAKTSQWFSLKRVDPVKVVNACRELKEIYVGNFTFKEYPLKLGMLKGNLFRIALRNVTAEDDVINKACQDLKENGFINYYGLQRFGTRIETPTYDIGLKLLTGNFREAVASILEEGAPPAPPGRGPRAPPHRAAMRASLARAPRDLMRALDKVPRNTRLLYVHSYQSLLWNRAVSCRVKRWGLKPVVGDLVLGEGIESLGDNDILEGEEEESDSEETQNEEKEEAQTNTPMETQETPEEDLKKDGTEQNVSANKQKQKQNWQPRPKIPVKVLTQEDIDSGKYTMFDIIMPLPGYNVDYPPNMKDFYEEMLTKDGLTLDLKNKIKKYSMSGAYRAVVSRPQLRWRAVRYDDPHGDLLLSDRDRLSGHDHTAELEDGKYKALLLTLELPSSCYATMALRELLRVDTSGDNQAKQNNYHKVDTKNEKEIEDVDKNETEELKRKMDGDLEEVEPKKVKTDE